MPTLRLPESSSGTASRLCQHHLSTASVILTTLTTLRSCADFTIIKDLPAVQLRDFSMTSASLSGSIDHLSRPLRSFSFFSTTASLLHIFMTFHGLTAAQHHLHWRFSRLQGFSASFSTLPAFAIQHFSFTKSLPLYNFFSAALISITASSAA